MYTKEQVETIIKETQIKENLNSPRQVLEKYPELNAIYSMVCIESSADKNEPSVTSEQSTVKAE
tara:strand:+ start:557 stop:748 length:192 start_codon:yes stop_codon:yes gene_type:complete